MTLEQIRADVTKACQNFGTHDFFDRGAEEVMDLSAIDDAIRMMSPEDAADLLEALLDIGAGDDWTAVAYEPLVSDLLIMLQDVPDETWEVLMSRPRLQELF
jgi:hypothetical protein